ncbi:hypothetical protein D9M71_767660 [compost metagenome]
MTLECWSRIVGDSTVANQANVDTDIVHCRFDHRLAKSSLGHVQHEWFRTLAVIVRQRKHVFTWRQPDLPADRPTAVRIHHRAGQTRVALKQVNADPRLALAAEGRDVVIGATAADDRA